MGSRMRRFRHRFRGKECSRRRLRRQGSGMTVRRLKAATLAVLAAFSLTYTVYSIESRLTPLVRDMALSVLNSMVLRECNDAVADMIEGGGFDYDKIVERRYDDAGSLKSLFVNYKNLNLFKSALTVDIQERIDQINSVDVTIPVMAMFSDKFYSPYGFPVTLRALTDENVSIDFIDEFTSAGINQTRHTISVKITVEIGVNVPIRDSGDDVVTEIPVAETVIAGEVPDAYFDFSEKTE